MQLLVLFYFYEKIRVQELVNMEKFVKTATFEIINIQYEGLLNRVQIWTSPRPFGDR